MSRRATSIVAGLGAGLLALGIVPAALAHTPGSHVQTQAKAQVKHVLLLSVDGLHESDLAYYIAQHPTSALAKLIARGTDYTRAKTTFPSDSFPGMVAQLTGADPGASGVYYDDTYNHALLPPGTTNCATATPGTEVSWTEAADKSQNPITLDAGEGLSDAALTALPTNTLEQTLASSAALSKAILAMTPNPQSLLDPAALPVNPATCLPQYPHQYLRVNTVFNVARAHGLRTAWSDKHAAYEILDGPSGTGIQDLFTPEINSVADSAGDDWTKDNALTREYDSFKVAAILNEIDGFGHSGHKRVGTPAIFGMNFQTVSTAEKLPVSDGLRGGYNAGGKPGPLLTQAMDYIDTEVSMMVARLRKDGLARSTTIILSAKHGQSPKNPKALRRVDDAAIISAMNAAWTKAGHGSKALVVFSVDDDGMLLWLAHRTPVAFAFATKYLLTHSAPANLSTDPSGTYAATVGHSGLTAVYTGAGADKLVSAPHGDPHAPDLIGIGQHGVVYTGGTKKIAEHGGAAADDRNVALVVSGAGARRAVNSTAVQTTQIAPTILQLLGLNPRALDAVRRTGTKVLPGS